MFMPYHYEAGGNFDILPLMSQQITSDVSGIIQEVYYDGGEQLSKGTLIGRLSVADYESQLARCRAKIEEQEAVLSDLRAKPRPEKVEIAQEDLKVQEVRTAFSAAKLARLEKLYRDGTISFEDYDEQKRQYEVDKEELKQNRARLELVKSGVTDEKIAGAEAKLKSIEAERDYYLEKIKQSVFYMPFGGHLTGLNLQQKVGSFLERGVPFAVAENTQKVYARIYVSETHISAVKRNAKVRVRPWAFPDEDFIGTVVDIDSSVTEREMDNIVEVQVVIDNPDGRLKPGMEGYAKISGQVMPVWEVMATALARFVKVEMWSWLP